MQIRAGFTVVELLITIVVMAILLTLGVAVFSDTQARARDKEREADVEAIARGLENYYKQGNSYITDSRYSTVGTYPGYYIASHAMGADVCWHVGMKQIVGGDDYCNSTSRPYISEVLSGVTSANLTSPQPDEKGFKTIWSGDPWANPLTQAQRNTLVTNGAYLYEAFTKDGADCTGNPGWYAENADPCVRFTISYKKEMIPGTQVVKSRHQ